MIGMVCFPATDACISPAVGDDLKVLRAIQLFCES